MVRIRPFEEGDTARLLAIEKVCPHGNEQCAVGVDKKSSITARYALYDNWNVLVAEEDDEDEAGAGEVGGWIGWTAKQSPTQQEPYVYLAEVMVHPDFRRKGVATTLVNEAEQHAQETGSSHLYCYIYGPNDASKALFEKLGYSSKRALKSCAVTAYKKAAIAAEDYTIERVTIRDIPAVVRLINEYYAGYAHFAPYTPEGFASYLTGIPGYGLEQFWVAREKEAEGGNVVACAGLWDWSVLAELCYTNEPRLWKVMRALLGFLSLFGQMPRIPAEGEYFRVYFMTDYAFEPDHAAAMSALINALNNFVLDANRDFFVANLDPDDPLVDVLKKFKPQIDTWQIYAKALGPEGELELPTFSPFYVDIRDCIL
ncbi:MAG TPA: GNAT family N-acetyltransferase [Desulfobacteria bacterium]|nr:GNAT family N-acetyltransferase [Desulfobacteria bacterium]